MTVAPKIVTVFEDPLTRQRPEGQAVIIRRIGKADPELGQKCVVHFLDDSPDQVVERWVKTREAIHARRICNTEGCSDNPRENGY